MHVMVGGMRRLSVTLRGCGAAGVGGPGISAAREPRKGGDAAATATGDTRGREERELRARLATMQRDLDATFFHKRTWARKQERAFVAWLNHVLVPQVTRRGLSRRRRPDGALTFQGPGSVDKRRRGRVERCRHSRNAACRAPSRTRWRAEK